MVTPLARSQGSNNLTRNLLSGNCLVIKVNHRTRLMTAKINLALCEGSRMSKECNIQYTCAMYTSTYIHVNIKYTHWLRHPNMTAYSTSALSACILPFLPLHFSTASALRLTFDNALTFRTIMPKSECCMHLIKL